MSQQSQEAMSEEENTSDVKLLDSLFDESCEMQVEERFGTEFWVTSISESLLESWQTGHTSAQLQLPAPNKFIATDFQLLQDCLKEDDLPHLPASKVAHFPVIRRLLPTPRQLTSERPGLRLWHLPCALRFAIPRSSFSLKIMSPHYVFDRSVRKDVLLELLAACLQDSLNETFYTASKAKLSCNFLDALYGLKISAGGFSQKLLSLVETMIQGLWLRCYTQHRFHAQWEELYRSYRNAWLKPQVHCAALRKLLLLKASRPSEKEAAIKNLEISDLRSFLGDFFASVDCEVLCSGNSSEQELRQVALDLVTAPCRAPDEDVTRLEPGTAAVWVEEAVDGTQSNCALEIYFQLPGRDDFTWTLERARWKCLLDLLEDMMYETLYDELRTKQQLGYSVGCNTRAAWCLEALDSRLP